MKKLLLFWLPPILWALLIFTFSSLATVKTSEIYWQDFVVKKLAHLTEYAVLSFLIYRGLASSGFSKEESGFYAILLSVFYAFTDEFHQSFTRGREPTMRDIGFDGLGASLAVFLVFKLKNLPLLNRVLK